MKRNTLLEEVVTLVEPKMYNTLYKKKAEMDNTLDIKTQDWWEQKLWMVDWPTKDIYETIKLCKAQNLKEKQKYYEECSKIIDNLTSEMFAEKLKYKKEMQELQKAFKAKQNIDLHLQAKQIFADLDKELEWHFGDINYQQFKKLKKKYGF